MIIEETQPPLSCCGVSILAMAPAPRPTKSQKIRLMVVKFGIVEWVTGVILRN